MKTNKDTKALENAGTIFTKLVTKKDIDKSKNAIEVNNLSFSIKGRLLLNKVSFSVKPGEVHGFLGPNGAGKTTTIKNIINAYTTRTKDSEILIGGFSNETILAKKKIAYIPEYAAFPKHLSLTDYLVTMACFAGETKDKAKVKSEELIALLELGKHANVNPNNFSSGMKKKVLLAQSLMTDPEVLILDEPAANLDPSARNMLFKSLVEISKQGIAVFISSHILAELEGLVDSLTLINNGNISYSGTVKDIKKKLETSNKHSIKVYVNTNDRDKVIVIAKKLKLATKEGINFIQIIASSRKKLNKVVEILAKEQVEMVKINFDNISLQDIYDKEFQ